MQRVTLAQRLLLAIGILTIATTLALGFGVRDAWRHTEEERFQTQFRSAVAQLQRELSASVKDLPALLAPLCEHDNMVDSAYVGLKAGDLGSRRVGLAERVPETMKALRLDELTLITNSGEILGAGHDVALVGQLDKRLAARVQRPGASAELRTRTAPLAVEAYCRHPGTGRVWVGLYGARHLESTLEQIGKSYDVALSLSQPTDDDELMVGTMRLPELGGVTLVATRSRVPLRDALQRLDSTIFLIGGVTFGAALIVAMLLSRGLARPIVNLARQARQVSEGDPKPVQRGGGKELSELADAFNQAILDLSAMRKRLAATERIAARREIARRVAHEIKNPLAPIRAAVETLRRLKARNDPAFEEYFDEATRTVLEEVTRISNIVTEFTRFARLPPPNLTTTDIVEAVRGVVKLHASSGAAIDFVAYQCPKINADRDQLIQVTTNLLQNAIDAAKSSTEPKVTVQIKPEPGERVSLSVSDNGPGVAPEMRSKLFEPYATTKPEGTGLGLAIAHRIVVEHGGDISYSDARGGGAVFTVLLPVSGPTLLPEAPTATPLSTRRS